MKLGLSRLTARDGLRACALAYLLPLAAAAQDYPSRPITVVIPYPTGGAIDNLIRPVAGALQKSLGQPVIVDNKPDAQGIVATQYAARLKKHRWNAL